LSDLPLIGNLFRSTTKGVDNQELLILITPRVVKDNQGGLGG
jgi:type II secretory pathway component GspD/PulD (secretin)